MTPVVADLSTEAGIASVDAALEDPRLTTVIDNAALAHYKPFIELPQAELTELVMLTALAPARLMRARPPALVRPGRGAVVIVPRVRVLIGGVGNPIGPPPDVPRAAKPLRFPFALEVGTYLPVAPFLAGATSAISARRLTDHLMAYFDAVCTSASS